MYDVDDILHSHIHHLRALNKFGNAIPHLY